MNIALELLVMLLSVFEVFIIMSRYIACFLLLWFSLNGGHTPAVAVIIDGAVCNMQQTYV